MLTKVSDDAAVFLHCVFQPFQGVIDGAECEDNLRDFALQCLQLIVIDGACNHAVAI